MRGRSGIVVPSLVVLALACLSSTAQAAFPGQNGKIAFTRVNSATVMVMNADGSNQTETAFGTADPAWSADGQKLAVNCWDQSVCIMNPDGSGQVEIGPGTAFGIADPEWSPDGTRIVVAEWMEYADPTEPDRWYYPDLVVGNNWNFQNLTNTSDVQELGPSWRPDGSLIAFNTWGGDGKLMRPDGTNVPGPSFGDNPDWSPDGWRLAYNAYDGHDQEIYVVNLDGSGRTQLTNNAVRDWLPAWSPDGQRIAYSSNEGGDDEIMVVNVDGTGRTALTKNTVGDLDPSWQPIPINTYARPRGATPFHASLTTAYGPCTAPDGTHGPPLAYPSCASPQKSSAHLTVGTGDSNGKPALNQGYLTLTTLVGAPGGPDDADVGINLFIDDVLTNGLADYTGEIRARVTLRITDKDNTPHPGGPGAATTTEIPLEAIAACTPIADPQEGSTCTTTTTADALAPGTVKEGRRSIWQLGRVEVYDGGADGDANTPAGDTLFATQGLFIP
jgi:TolB protein